MNNPLRGGLAPKTWLARAGLLRRLVRKELSEILRDRRTILTLLLMPLLLYPLLGVALWTFVVGSMTAPAEAPVYRVGVHPGDEGAAILDYLQHGEQALHDLEQRQREATGVAEGDESAPHRPPLAKIDSVKENNLEAAVRQAQVDVAIRPRQPGPFEVRWDRPLTLDWDVLYREDSANGIDAVRHLDKLLNAANARYLSCRLYVLRVRQREVPVRMLPAVLRDPRPRRSVLLAGLVPLVLILMTITGAVYPAIDLTAGERERGTLEILAAAPVSRLSILAAKYAAVLTVALLTAVVNLGSMTVTLLLTGVGQTLFGDGGLSFLVLVQVLALLLLFAAFFSAALLVLTSFARSFKEAQAYLVPLMLLALLPGVLSLVPGLSLEGPLAIVPLLNIALLSRDLLEGTARAGTAAVVVLSTLLYALAALALAARVFAAEAVLYTQPGGWTDLFRRSPRVSRRAAAAAPAAAGPGRERDDSGRA